jgi:hypothetical protein
VGHRRVKFSKGRDMFFVSNEKEAVEKLILVRG